MIGNVFINTVLLQRIRNENDVHVKALSALLLYLEVSWCQKEGLSRQFGSTQSDPCKINEVLPITWNCITHTNL